VTLCGRRKKTYIIVGFLWKLKKKGIEGESEKKQKQKQNDKPKSHH